jgi:hypothetical protein
VFSIGSLHILSGYGFDIGHTATDSIFVVNTIITGITQYMSRWVDDFDFRPTVAQAILVIMASRRIREVDVLPAWDNKSCNQGAMQQPMIL